MMNAMTLLQEEQEKPQSKVGPTRHAKIMRGIVTPIFGLLAITCIVLGVLNATIWKPSTQVSASATVTGPQYVVTDPNVLQLVDDRVTISAKSRDKSANVCIAIGSARDVAGWIAGSKYTRVTGLSDWSALSTLKATAQGTADNSEGQVTFQDSDMWRTVKCNAGSVDMQIKGANTNNAGDSVAIIDYGNRKGGSVTLDWTRRSMLNFAMPFYLSGGLLAILAVLSASVFAMPPHKRRNKRVFAMVDGIGSTQGDDDEVAAWVKNAEASAARSDKSGTNRKRRRHASHRATGSENMQNEMAQPTIVDPSARNLVADQQNAATDGVGENDDFEQTSVISQDELAAYFARLAQEESSAAAASSGSVEFAVSDEINVSNEVDEMAVTAEPVESNETSDNDESDESDNEEAK